MSIASRGYAAARDSGPKKAEARAALRTIAPEGLSVIADGEWEEFELAVDSGAGETVVSEDMILSAEVREGAASKRGVEYEVANGVRIPNVGREEVRSDQRGRHKQTPHRPSLRSQQRPIERQQGHQIWE